MQNIGIRRKFGNRTIVILLILCGIIAYVNSLGNSFIWDDSSLIVENPLVKNWRWFPKIFTEDLHYRSSRDIFYRPVQIISFLFDYSIWKLNPFGYHLANAILHIINTILLFFLIILLSKNKIVSLIASLFFLLHPVQTQAVTYIAGRADLLLVFFFLSSFLLLLFYFSKRKKICYFLSIFFFIFALFSKEIALIIPFFFLLYFILFQKNKFSSLIPYFFVSLAYALLRSFWLVPYSTQKMVPCPFPGRLLTLPKVILSYFSLLLFPLHLHMDRQVKVCHSISEPSFFLPFLFLIFILIGMVKLFRRKDIEVRLAFFGISSFFLLLFPNLNIVIPLNAMMAEHWLYLPSIGFFLAVSIGIKRVSTIKGLQRLVMPFLVILFALYSVRVILRNRDWSNKIRFYENTLLYAPYSSRVHCNLGVAYSKKGNYKKAFEEWQKAIRINPRHFLAYNNIGIFYRREKNYKMAKRYFKKAIELNPKFVGGYYNFGILFRIEKNYEEAIKYLKKALSFSPYYPEVHNNLAICYVLKEPPEITLAKKHLQHAKDLDLKIDPGFLKYLEELEAKSRKD